MKRFHWPLQRLLDVTNQREQSQRAGLLGLSREIAQGRQQVMVHRMSIRRMILEVSELDVGRRMQRHPDFVRTTAAHEQRIERLEGELASLARQRTEKTEQLLKTRKSRETLDRLRADALSQHMREQTALEQKQFDESAHMTKARRLIEARRNSE